MSTLLSIQTARSLHFLVMCWFLLFIVMHVTLVLTTGLRRQSQPHVRGPRRRQLGRLLDVRRRDGGAARRLGRGDAVHPAASPCRPTRRSRASIGPLQRLFEHLDAKPGQYTEADISPYMWHNGKYPETEEYKALYDSGFANYRLEIGGLVATPSS